jgi:hypothetical protein
MDIDGEEFIHAFGAVGVVGDDNYRLRIFFIPF